MSMLKKRKKKEKAILFIRYTPKKKERLHGWKPSQQTSLRIPYGRKRKRAK